MLEIKKVSKQYKTGDLVQNALSSVSLEFRSNEFVAVLGPSGSGKTTLLNIIGGLDRYDSGDLVINGVSTKQYTSRDWDTYRNHTVGFVFQSYNLIPHQSVLSNVELALTLSGVSKQERRRRACEALEQVGLKGQEHKRPNQMSGGQMQRVAIARALVNNPDILLADEPTGALDSETGTQVMELLKKVAKDRLVIMVTHNAELAEQYATRIVKLHDGQISSDTNPVSNDERTLTKEKERRAGSTFDKKQKKKRTSMSFFTALSLSLNNLSTKKGRTFLTSFAGSIGIIGIALILALSTGIQNYVNAIQKDTLTSYPITVEREPNDFMSMLTAANEKTDDETLKNRDADSVYSDPRLYKMLNATVSDGDEVNDLASFKKYIDSELDASTAKTDLREYVSSVRYGYGLTVNAYVIGTDGKYHSTDMTSALFADDETSEGDKGVSMINMMTSRMGNMNLWDEILSGADGALVSELVLNQYELVAGEWPKSANDIVLVIDKNNEVSDVAFYALGLMDTAEITRIFNSVLKGEEIVTDTRSAKFEELIGTKFKLILNSDYYSKSYSTDENGGSWKYIGDDAAAMDLVIKNGLDLRLAGIIRPNDNKAASVNGVFGYTSALSDYIIQKTNESEIVREQKSPENVNLDVLTGLPFTLDSDNELSADKKAEEVTAYFASLTDMQKTEIYKKIIAEPEQAELDAVVEEYMAMYPTRESMVQLAAATYGFDVATAEEYLSDYTDEELRTLMREQLVSAVKKKYADKAEAEIMQIIFEHSAPNDLFGTAGYAAVADIFDKTIANDTSVDKLAEYYDKFMPSKVSGTTLDEALEKLGAVDPDSPKTVNLYAATFEDKEAIADNIAEYNRNADEDKAIEYTDYVALLMSGVTTMIDAVSYGLIAFVAISLVVSSIMIGIITYISVLERTKEIGILRSIGASKRDISSVFNAETLIIGFCAGAIGIIASMLLCIPLNLIVRSLTGIDTLTAVLPWRAGIILVLISMVLTLIAGIIPSRIAAKKDPVAALRSE